MYHTKNNNRTPCMYYPALHVTSASSTFHQRGSNLLEPSRHRYAGISEKSLVRHGFRACMSGERERSRRYRGFGQRRKRDLPRECLVSHLKPGPWSKRPKSQERSKPFLPTLRTPVVLRTSRTRRRPAGPRADCTRKTTQSSTRSS